MEKHRWEESERRREAVRRSERRKSEKKEEAGARKVGKSRFTLFFQWFVAPDDRKVGSLKRRVRSQLARWEMKNCTPLWREAHFQVKMYKAHHVQHTFGSWKVEKVHAAVAQSTFSSQNVQSTPTSDHFWKLRGRKSARRFGAKRIFKSRCTKHTTFSTLLEVERSKKCTLLWRKAHFQVKMYKAHQRRTTFGSWDVEKVHTVVARSTFSSQNVQSTPRSAHFWKLKGRKSVRRCGAKHISKSKVSKTPHARTTFWRWDVEKVHAVVARNTFRSRKCQKLWGSDRFWTVRCRFAWLAQGILHLLKSEQHLRVCSSFNYKHQYTTLHYTTLHYTTLHYTTLHYTTLHYTTLH